MSDDVDLSDKRSRRNRAELETADLSLIREQLSDVKDQIERLSTLSRQRRQPPSAALSGKVPQFSDSNSNQTTSEKPMLKAEYSAHPKALNAAGAPPLPETSSAPNVATPLGPPKPQEDLARVTPAIPPKVSPRAVHEDSADEERLGDDRQSTPPAPKPVPADAKAPESKTELQQVEVHTAAPPVEEQMKELAKRAIGDALRHIAEDNLDEALKCARVASQADPSAQLGWHVWATLGLSFFENNRLDDTIEAYKNAVRLAPEAVESWFNLGVAYFDKGDIEESLRCYLKASTLDPNNAKIACNLGSVYFDAQKLDFAAQCFERAVFLKPDYARAWGNLGATYGAMSRFEDAERSCRKAIAIEPGLADPWFKLGSIMFQLERFSEAQQTLEHLVEVDQGFGDAYAYLAVLYARNNEVARAADSCRAMDDLDFTPSLASIAWNELGVRYFEQEDYDSAAWACEKASKLDPKEGEPWLNYGLACYYGGRYEDAESALFFCVQILPKSAQTWHHLGVVRYALNNFEGAIEAFTQATHLDEAFAMSWRDLSSSHLKLGNVEEAIKALRVVMKLGELNDQDWVNLGLIYLHQRNFDMAASTLEQGSRKHPEAWRIWYELGRANIGCKNLSKATDALERASKAHPTRLEVWKLLAAVYNKTGNTEMAEFALAKIAELGQQYDED